MTCGIIFIAFGQRYTDEAVYSAETVKRHSGLPVTLFTDAPIRSAAVDEVVVIDPRHKRAKVDYISQSPYERTLYLDSDTRVVRDIGEIFQLLDRFELAAVQDHCRKNSRWSALIPDYDAIPYSFPEYNGGVVLFRASASTAAFFDLWRTLFYRHEKETVGQDQASFRMALWQSGLNLHSLPVEYNVRNKRIRDRMAERAKTTDLGLLEPRILHWHGLNEKRLLGAWRSKFRPMNY
jgi:hypothetical protein